jgi:Acetyltransferase (GNAT) family
VVAMAQSNIRGHRWVLSNLGVLPDYQDRNIGRSLLDATLAYANGCAAGAIFASQDLRAVHRYVRAAFTLNPAVAALGPVRVAVKRPRGVREAHARSLTDVDAVDRVVRGSTRRHDIEFQLASGYRLLFDEEGGYALVRDGRIAMLAALSDAVGRRLLNAHLAALPVGHDVGVHWLTARDQWAISALAEAGVGLHVQGAVMWRGDAEPNGAYLPHGIFG